jgi:hypothetical protein
MEMSEKSHWVKPQLKDRDKMLRVRFVLLEIESLDDPEDRCYRSQRGRCYLDEKWFRLEKIKKQRKFFINSPPARTHRMRSKAHPTQLMFTTVITEPSPTQTGCVTLMPHYHEEPAKRNSVNRLQGTLINKTPYNIDSANFYECMTIEDGLLEAVNDGVPGHKILQVDNAPGHTGKNNPEDIDEYILENDLDIEPLLFQPPDLNICDLAFFRSLSCRADEIKVNLHTHGLLDAVLESVEAAFDDYDDETLEIIFGHLFRIYDPTLATNGDNSFEEPHANVRSMD